MNATSVLRRASLAAFLLLLPALAAALPMNLPPTTEVVVEGHTVFATIEASMYTVGAGATMRFGASIAETAAAGASGPAETSMRILRTPGVLWFNDQYLVSPATATASGLGTNDTVSARYSAAVAVLVRQEEGFGRIRHPCGGAVLAVDAGDPDPRMALVSSDGSGFALVGVDSYGGSQAHSDTAGSFAGLAYGESYLITDPNDQPWVIDRYTSYVRTGTNGPFGVSRMGAVWVVNIGGGAAFVPDTAGMDCPPGAVGPVAGASTETPLGEASSIGCGSGFPAPRGPVVRDSPCMGMASPSRNGYCYPGQPYVGGCDRGQAPSREYSALLYFPLDGLRVWSGPRDHSSPGGSWETNGCQVGTEWPCPADDDDEEGSSHGFHPMAPPHRTAQPCYVPGSLNPTNHGGSTGPSGRCDYFHATRAVDLYFSADARPAPPAVRTWAILDRSGSDAPFADHHAAYPDEW